VQEERRRRQEYEHCGGYLVRVWRSVAQAKATLQPITSGVFLVQVGFHFRHAPFVHFGRLRRVGAHTSKAPLFVFAVVFSLTYDQRDTATTSHD
jgi:hypothetical protein